MKVQFQRHQRILAGITLIAVCLLVAFQNCGGEGGSLKGLDDPNSGTYASTTNPDGTVQSVPVVAGNIFYSPIRSDTVCHDNDPTKQQIIRIYVKYLKRCADRAGLENWFHHSVRSNLGNDFSSLIRDIQASNEFQNLTQPGKTPSDRLCLPGDVYQVLGNNKILSVYEMSSLSLTDSKVLANRCATVNSQNAIAASTQTVRLEVSTAHDWVCSVPGDTTRNSVIAHYITYLNRCPEVAGLNFWAGQGWNPAAFTGSPDVIRYQNCRYPGGDPNAGTLKDPGTCYLELFNRNLCPNGGRFIPPMFCEK